MRILRQPVRQYPQTKFKIVVVSGLSNPLSCELTPAQASLIALPELPSESVVTRNFPFCDQIDADDSILSSYARKKPHQASLIRASYSNGLQFIRTWSAEYHRNAIPHWNALLHSVDHLLVISGSCGIQLLTSCKQLQGTFNKVHLLALGPVGLLRPTFPTVLLQGNRDWLSRAFFRSPDTIVHGVGHMDYWEHPQVREIAIQWLRDKIFALPEQAVIFPSGR